MNDETPRPGEKTYAVRWQKAAGECSDEVAARNAGEAVWLVHARHEGPAGSRYTVTPLDGSEPDRSFTVGHPRGESPYSN